MRTSHKKRKKKPSMTILACKITQAVCAIRGTSEDSGGSLRAAAKRNKGKLLEFAQAFRESCDALGKKVDIEEPPLLCPYRHVTVRHAGGGSRRTMVALENNYRQ